MTAMLVAATLFAATPAPVQHNARPGCPKTFTVPMVRRAIDVAYGGARDVSARERSRLRRFVRCARRPEKRVVMRRYWHNAWAAWKLRRYDAAHPFSTAFVSYYDDAGTHCCGVYATYGVADCGSGGGPCYPMGTKIEFCDRGCVVATVDDHGPYVGGREWDLNQNTAAAIGFPGLGYVQWRLR